MINRAEEDFQHSGGVRSMSTTRASSRPLSAEDELGRIYRSQLNAFNQYQKPQIKELEDSLSDTSIVDNAQKLSDNMEDKVKGTTSRTLQMNMSQLTPAQRKAMERNQGRAIALGRGGVMTQAYDMQRKTRVATRQQLLNIGEQLTNSGTASLAGAAEAKNRRDAENKAASKGFMSQALTIAGAVVGGIYGGGPAGAAAGASIGGSIGGAAG